MRKFLLGLFALIFSLFLVGSIYASGAKEQAAGGTAKLVLATNNAPEGNGIAQALRQWGQMKGIQVEVVAAPYSNIYEKEVLDLSQKTGLYDIVLLDDPWFTQFAESKWLTNLTPYFVAAGQGGLSSDFIDKSTAICKYPYATGLIYAFPAVGNAQMFFYRKDILAQQGMPNGPSTWDDVYAVGKKISDNGGGTMFGYVLRGTQGNPVVADFMPILWSFGARMFSPDFKQVTLNTPQALNAVNFLAKLVSIAPPGSASFDAQQLATFELEGNAAMMINWPAFAADFQDPSKSKVVGKIGYAPIPSEATVGSSEIGHWLAAIPAASKNKQAAFDFLQWATSAEGQKTGVLSFGNPPTRKSVFTDPQLLAMPQFSYFPTLLQAISNSTPRPRIANWNEVENTFGIYLSKVVAGTMTAQAALAGAQADVTALMKKAGYIE
ncbi:MAG TPA: extracellular solute-binding protein [Spirochaetia bacterium]|nr:extracellular solute-binding protein [Spirochaetia bacterium]